MAALMRIGVHNDNTRERQSSKTRRIGVATSGAEAWSGGL